MKFKEMKINQIVILLVISLLILIAVDSRLFYFGQNKYLPIISPKLNFLKPLVMKENREYELSFEYPKSTVRLLGRNDHIKLKNGGVIQIGKLEGYAYSDVDFYVFTVNSNTNEKIKIQIDETAVSNSAFEVKDNWNVESMYTEIYIEPFIKIGLLLWLRRLLFLILIILLSQLVMKLFQSLGEKNLL